MSLLDRLSNPKVRANLAPYADHVRAQARALGVPEDFVIGTIVAESTGIRDAIGDGGVAHGIYQVHTPYLKDYGMKTDVRMDPIAATTAIMPSFKQIVDKAGGDWALGRIMYMRGQNSNPVKALRAGKAPEEVFKSDPVALDQYKQFARLQSRKGTSSYTRAVPTPASVPYTPVDPASIDQRYQAKQGAPKGPPPQNPLAPVDLAGIDPRLTGLPQTPRAAYTVPAPPALPQYQPDPVLAGPARQYRPAIDVDEQLRALGIQPWG